MTDWSLPQARRLQAQWTRRAYSLALAEFEIGLVRLAHKQYNCSKMIRTHIFTCRLPKEQADSFNRESGRIYTETLVEHYRVYRRSRHWFSGGAGEKINDLRCHLASRFRCSRRTKRLPN